MVLAVAKMDAGNPPQNAGMRRVGKRNSRVIHLFKVCYIHLIQWFNM